MNLESDIVLRSGLEAAISIAANFKLKHAFVMLMRQDAAWTLQRQIKLHRDNGERELVRDGEAALRDLQSTIPAGLKPAKLEWKLLAEQGGVAQLYDFHRLLSGVSSHVTGLSILRGVSGANLSGTDFGAGGTTRKMHLMILAGSTLTASMLHAGMIDDEESVSAALAITNRLNDLSLEWPRTGP